MSVHKHSLNKQTPVFQVVVWFRIMMTPESISLMNNKFHNEFIQRSLVTLNVVEIQVGFECTINASGNIYKGQGSSKKKAKVQAIVTFFEAIGEDISIFQKCSIQSSPVEMINSWSHRNKHEAIVFTDRYKPLVSASLRLKNGKTYTASYKNYKDYRYVKNKLCLCILRQLAADDVSDSRNIFSGLSKYPCFLRGASYIPSTGTKEEGYDLEYKGATDPDKPVHMKAILHKKDDFGKTVCAFMNGSGGSVVLGVHDGVMHRVQGVSGIGNIDEFSRRIMGSFKNNIAPYDPSLIRMDIVALTEDYIIDCYDFVTDEDATLKHAISRLEAIIQSLQPKKLNKSVYIVEINVKPHPIKNVTYRGKRYMRNKGETIVVEQQTFKSIFFHFRTLLLGVFLFCFVAFLVIVLFV